MKNFILKVKKAIVTTGIAIISIPNKIFATMNDYSGQDLYGPPPITREFLYGPPSPKSAPKSIWTIFRWSIIPIALLIGIIAYFKKSKSSLKKKIIVTIGVVATALLCLIINSIINNK